MPIKQMRGKQVRNALKITFVGCVFAVSLMVVFQGLATPHPVFATSNKVDEYDDITYATTSAQNKLDLYIPKVKGPFPLIIWIHGGGWEAGDKKETPPALPFVEHDYAVASLNYRYSSEAVFPAQLYDLKAAVRWLRANAATYKINPDQFIAWGGSAGGHLVAVLGTSGDVKTLEDLSMGNPTTSSRVQGVIDWFGPVDFLRASEQDLKCSPFNHDSMDSPENRLIGCVAKTCTDKANVANPVTYVTPDDPPFLIQQGTNDCLVAPGQSQILADALKAKNVPVVIDFFDAGHGDPKFVTIENYMRINAFMTSVLEKKK